MNTDASALTGYSQMGRRRLYYDQNGEKHKNCHLDLKVIFKGKFHQSKVICFTLRYTTVTEQNKTKTGPSKGF